MNSTQKLLLGVIAVGLILIALGIAFLLKADPPIQTQVTAQPSPQQANTRPASTPTPTPAPKSPFIENGAYKYEGKDRVYIYKTGKFYPVTSWEAYERHYGCGKVRDLTDCAPIYVMPGYVTGNMISSELIR